MNYGSALIEGLLEGLAGILPLSSSGHRLIIEKWMDLPQEGGPELFAKLGALLAVILSCQKAWKEMARGIGETLEKRKRKVFRWNKAPRGMILLLSLLIACIPPVVAAIIRLFYDYTALIGQNLAWAGAGFLISAGLLFIGDHSQCHHWEAIDLSAGHAFKLGLFRAIGGIFPGFSPLGITAAMGMNMGYEPAFAVDFSILLSAPLLLGEVLMQVAKLSWGGFSWGCGLIAFATAFGAALLSIFLIRALAKKNRFGIFLYYCIAAGIAALILN